MKYILSITIIFLFLLGCGDEKSGSDKVSDENLFKVDSSEIKTTPVENPNQHFLMRYKMELDKEYKYRIATITDNKQTIKLDTVINQNVNQQMIYIVSVKPTELDKDSIYEVSCTFNSIKLDAIANNQKHTYQSGVTKDSTELLKFANYEALINNSFNLRVDTKGNILEIYKTDKIISKYLEMQNLKDSISADERNAMREQISEGAIKPLLSQVFRKLPDSNVAKDSSWTISQPVVPFLVFQLQNNYIYDITGLESFNDENVAVVEANLQANITGNTKVSEQGWNYEFDKPSSVASGKIYFNVEKGYVIKSTIKSKTTISYSMEGNTPTGKQKGSRADVMEYTNIVELL
ncbi:MAG TPA: DUF6263 family protein [Ignavibacteriaceae bacterium]|nr:DUF6263 family protein [Ignavibacteriaceae bacterium]